METLTASSPSIHNRPSSSSSSPSQANSTSTSTTSTKTQTPKPNPFTIAASNKSSSSSSNKLSASPSNHTTTKKSATKTFITTTPTKSSSTSRQQSPNSNDTDMAGKDKPSPSSAMETTSTSPEPSRKRSIADIDVDLDLTKDDNDNGNNNGDKKGGDGLDKKVRELSISPQQPQQQTATGAAPPAKKKKLTPAEKEAKEKEKAEKDKQKEAERLAKEAEKEKKEKERKEKEAERLAEKEKKEKEKAEKDKERAEKEVEKAKLKAERDEKKRIKDEEKKKKDEAAAKKEKSQLRVFDFFKKPGAAANRASSVGATSANGDTDMVDLTTDNNNNSNNNKNSTTAAGSSTTKKQDKADMTDYEKYFKDFFIKTNVEVAKTNYFKKDDAAVEFARRRLDEYLQHANSDSSEEEGGEGSDGGDEMDIDEEGGQVKHKKRKRIRIPQPLPKGHFSNLLQIPPHKLKPRGLKQRYNTQQILSGLNESSEPIFDEMKANNNNDGGDASKKGKNKPDYLAMLKALPIKHLHFAEDVRPPYRGTYTRVPTSPGLRRGRKYLSKSLPGVNYEYDSEAEWVDLPDEGEGEDLLSEEDDDAMSGDSEGEMEDFLNDEDEDEAVIKARRQIIGPLVPNSTGLMWEEEQIASGMDKWDQFRMGVLIENLNAPIDPFSTIYWDPKPKVSAKDSSSSVPVANALTNMLGVTSAGAAASGSMPPPGKPGTKSDGATTTTATATGKKGKKDVALVADEDLEEFKSVVNGNELSKLGIVEVLKKRLPKYSKDSLKATLDAVAHREGQKEADKKWVLN